MAKLNVRFKGVDSRNRPIFVDKLNNHYGSTDKLFDYDATESKVLETITESDLTFFGRKFDCEPMGDPVDNIIIVRD